MELNVPLQVIGIARTGRTALDATPIQAAINRAEHGTIEIGEAYKDGLDGLAGFSYAWMLTWLHESGDPALEPDMSRMPFLLRKQGRRVGLFATRAPRRANPIGLSLIEILAVTGSSVSFAGVDVIDGTPVIDIKPYVTKFDRPPVDPHCGWFDEVTVEQGVTPAKLTPPDL
ncbi:MAG TPA: tRNA (N6-threonylcarbamoyladenosine(37)-N6)-methyltransferase TrmO [Streptosporangiaceae bacterium]|nr:tRNA (N6-threonylcarbamoyladenosine(37)-N6)-methyltransferase TrmO [Streptosporangiaceae bacterium]